MPMSAHGPLPRFAGLVLVVALTGCSGLATREPARLPAADAWTLEGRIALRLEEEGWHASVVWQQRPGSYRLRLQGPLGQGALELTGSAAGVILERADGRISQARDPDILLYQETGWQLPVSGLRYWVRGRPVPDIGARSRRDDQGRLVELHQAGWDIRYTDFFATGALPRRIELVNGEVRVKLIIDQWQHLPAADEADDAS